MKLEQKIRINANVPLWFVKKELDQTILGLDDCVSSDEFEENKMYEIEILRTMISYYQRAIDYISQLTYEDVKGGE